MKCKGYFIDLHKISFHNIFSVPVTLLSTFVVLTPNQYKMKKIYLMLFMVVSIGLYAQDTIDINNLDNDEITGFKLYPNPAIADVVYVTTQQNSLKEIRVYDVFGELVLTDKLSAKALNISRLSPGVYVVQVTENNKSITRKLVVK